MGVEPAGLLAEGLMGTVSVLEVLCVCFCLSVWGIFCAVVQVILPVLIPFDRCGLGF